MCAHLLDLTYHMLQLLTNTHLCCVACTLVHVACPGVPRNLILKFKDDTIDDSVQLTQLLQSSAAISSRLNLSLRTLDGDHIRPLTQVCMGW